MLRINLSMTSDRAGLTESGRRIEPGTLVEYVCHLPGPVVRVRVDGLEEIMAPDCFPQLRAEAEAVR